MGGLSEKPDGALHQTVYSLQLPMLLFGWERGNGGGIECLRQAQTRTMEPRSQGVELNASDDRSLGVAALLDIDKQQGFPKDEGQGFDSGPQRTLT